ncbi:MAG: BrnT family toxin [Spirochaetes bacterium]|nr:BrnT family toxin [Spirochaetota bacterium]
MIEILDGVTGFQWDKGNRNKNHLSHQVSNGEAEQMFFNLPPILWDDEKHSQGEQRHALLGTTDEGRWLTIIFTIRGTLIRVISARDMSRKERGHYENQQQ